MNKHEYNFYFFFKHLKNKDFLADTYWENSAQRSLCVWLQASWNKFSQVNVQTSAN